MSKGEFRRATDRLYEASDAFDRAEEQLRLVVARMQEPGFRSVDFIKAMEDFIDSRVAYNTATREQDDASNRRHEE